MSYMNKMEVLNRLTNGDAYRSASPPLWEANSKRYAAGEVEALQATRDTENLLLRAEFRDDVEREERMSDHPQRDLLWELVLQYGVDSYDRDSLDESIVYRSMYEAYLDFVKLVRD